MPFRAPPPFKTIAVEGHTKRELQKKLNKATRTLTREGYRVTNVSHSVGRGFLNPSKAYSAVVSAERPAPAPAAAAAARPAAPTGTTAGISSAKHPPPPAAAPRPGRAVAGVKLANGDPWVPSPKAAFWIIGVFVAGGLVLWGLGFGASEPDPSPATHQNRQTFTDSPSNRNEPSGSDSGSISFCPDRLEALGPFVQGVDRQYDPAMDWDGDGVSCE